ncbi:MAG: integrase arm-type DNA-binding domain-containing protein [Acidobacteria bacterium]|nr:integrase arm-type DNA-binding domain-containing protein [Acidobacteriota bacterium]
MPKQIVQLSDLKVKQAKPAEKAFKLYDGHGLFVLVTPTGGKWWRLRYLFRGKEQLLSLGTYPEVGVSSAREEAKRLREQLAAGRDPAAARRADRMADCGRDTFEAVGREWYERNASGWSDTHRATILERLERDVFPWLKDRPIADIEAPEVLAVLRRVEDRGAEETARRERQVIGQIFRYGIATARCKSDPAAHLVGALAKPSQRHFPAITNENELGQLLQAMWDYRGTAVVKAALRLTTLLLLRPGELRRLKWGWVDLEKRLVEIPGDFMKNALPHLVPLARQVVAELEELRPVTGESEYVFPAGWGGSRPMSEAGVLQALRRLGYGKEQLVAHSFRTTASTLLNESMKWSADAVELQLAHKPKDRIRAIYNRAQRLDERTRMMQWWADRLDTLRLGTERRIVALGEKQ